MKPYAKSDFTDAAPIHFEAGASNNIAIYARDTLRWMRFDDSDIQSVCDLSEPWRPVAPYCLSMLAALCLRPDPSQILNLGLGGGTFERFFQEKLPRARLTTVESSPTVISLAKRFFELSDCSNIVEASAPEFLNACTQKFDLILIDLFDDQGHLPCLGETQFYRDLASITADSGLVVIDIAPSDEDALLDILVATRPNFPHVMLSTDTASSNMVLICSRNPTARWEDVQVRAAQLHTATDIDFTEALGRFTQLPKPITSD